MLKKKQIATRFNPPPFNLIRLPNQPIYVWAGHHRYVTCEILLRDGGSAVASREATATAVNFPTTHPATPSVTVSVWGTSGPPLTNCPHASGIPFRKTDARFRPHPTGPRAARPDHVGGVGLELSGRQLGEREPGAGRTRTGLACHTGGASRAGRSCASLAGAGPLPSDFACPPGSGRVRATASACVSAPVNLIGRSAGPAACRCGGPAGACAVRRRGERGRRCGATGSADESCRSEPTGLGRANAHATQHKAKQGMWRPSTSPPKVPCQTTGCCAAGRGGPDNSQTERPFQRIGSYTNCFTIPCSVDRSYRTIFKDVT
jgi:hypothetical protein